LNEVLSSIQKVSQLGTLKDHSNAAAFKAYGHADILGNVDGKLFYV